MKVLLLALFIGAIAALEFRHELGGGHTDHFMGAACMAPQSQLAYLNDTLLRHVQSHR
jgi:hypothetical protein